MSAAGGEHSVVLLQHSTDGWNGGGGGGGELVGWMDRYIRIYAGAYGTVARSFIRRTYLRAFVRMLWGDHHRQNRTEPTDGGFAGLLLLLLHDGGGSGGGGVGRGLANERAVGATACWLQQIGLIGRTRVSSA